MELETEASDDIWHHVSAELGTSAGLNFALVIHIKVAPSIWESLVEVLGKLSTLFLEMGLHDFGGESLGTSLIKEELTGGFAIGVPGLNGVSLNDGPHKGVVTSTKEPLGDLSGVTVHAALPWLIWLVLSNCGVSWEDSVSWWRIRPNADSVGREHYHGKGCNCFHF